MTNRKCSVEVFFSKDGVPQYVLIGDIQGYYPFPIFHAHGYVAMKREPVKPPTWDIRPDVVLFNHARDQVRDHDVVFSESSYKHLYANEDGFPRMIHREILGRTGPFSWAAR